MWEISANLLLPKALKSCPNSNKSPNLVTLIAMQSKQFHPNDRKSAANCFKWTFICICLYFRIFSQCDQIGRFLKSLDDICSLKIAKFDDGILGRVNSMDSLVKTTVTPFGATFGKTWANFYFQHLVTLFSAVNST